MRVREQQNYVKKSQLPKDIVIAKGQSTLTYGQLQQAIQENNAEQLTLGIGMSQGFDSCMFLARAVVVNNALYLLTKSYISSSSLQRNAVLINLKTLDKQLELYEPKAKDLAALALAPDAPVWIGIRKNFSWKGEMILFSVETMGPHCFVTLLPSEDKQDDEDKEVYHEVGQLSVWGEQLTKTAST